MDTFLCGRLRRPTISACLLLAGVLLAVSRPVAARQVPAEATPEAPADAAGEPPATAPKVNWQAGPIKAELGKLAAIDVPEGYVFLDAADTRTMLEAMGNLTGDTEQGSIYPQSDQEDWFVVFEFEKVGYVKDDDKDALDAAALLASMQESNTAANEEKTKRGMPTMELVGWEEPPHYNAGTHNLEWCLRFTSGGTPVLNCNTRLLGRNGVMSVTLVADPEDLAAAMPRSRELLAKYDYQTGERYAEFKPGDKIAEYGLAGLVLGGAAAVALKTGLLQKFGKLIVFALMGAAAFIKKIINRMRSGTSVERPPGMAPPL